MNFNKQPTTISPSQPSLYSLQVVSDAVVIGSVVKLILCY